MVSDTDRVVGREPHRKERSMKSLAWFATVAVTALVAVAVAKRLPVIGPMLS